MGNLNPGKLTAPRPFLKWAGGKTQLWPTIQQSLPGELASGKLGYVEPFLGGGAVLFNLRAHYPAPSFCTANDLNPDLHLVYSVVQQRVEELIASLQVMEAAYYSLDTEGSRRGYFEQLREDFNGEPGDSLHRAALLVVLNKTCFNGLYRVNRMGKFNVPFGRYERPRLCDPPTLRAASDSLQGVKLTCGDFAATLAGLGGTAFFYLDPPYKPVSSTANFTAYSADGFGDAAQRRLAAFCRQLDAAGHLWLMSNSDLQDGKGRSTFFEELYQGYHIRQVRARRAINSKATGRGEVSELLISNYRLPNTLG